VTEGHNEGSCSNCHQAFDYTLVGCGFGDCVYAYCDTCGRTAILSLWDKRMPRLEDCPVQQEMCSAMEPYVQACVCGGHFRRGSSPRCRHCNVPLSADAAAVYIEANAPGTKKGWRWQRSWSGVYCIVVDNRVVHDNFEPVDIP
jgi:hypothetical protein